MVDLVINMKHCPNPSALFGDLELAIDLMLNGDPTVKHQVALADQKDHGGYQTLINAMRRIGVKPTTSKQERLLQSLSGDQDYYNQKLHDLTSISHRDGVYRVRVRVEHNRYSKTFTSLFAAQKWRDRMMILNIEKKHYIPKRPT